MELKDSFQWLQSIVKEVGQKWISFIQKWSLVYNKLVGSSQGTVRSDWGIKKIPSE